MAANATRPSVEWRTVAVAVAVHGLWLAVLAFHEPTPWPLTVVLLGFVTAWHGSLQHETVHGHPFPSRRLNILVASLPMALNLPYLVYRRYHLAHHECADLTDPTDDSESFYVSAECWESMGRVRRAIVLAHHTLLGRLVLGPPRYVAGVFVHQAREIRRGDRELARWWSLHAVAAAALTTFVVLVMGVPWWQYLLGAVYLGELADAVEVLLRAPLGGGCHPLGGGSIPLGVRAAVPQQQSPPSPPCRALGSLV